MPADFPQSFFKERDRNDFWLHSLFPNRLTTVEKIGSNSK